MSENPKNASKWVNTSKIVHIFVDSKYNIAVNV